MHGALRLIDGNVGERRRARIRIGNRDAPEQSAAYHMRALRIRHVRVAQGIVGVSMLMVPP